MIDHHGIFLLSAALGSILTLIFLIAVVKINPFIVLVVTSLALALVTGMPVHTIVNSFEVGLGSTLGHIAIVVGLGTMLGKMMAESGGADQIANTLIRIFGKKHVHWAMMAIGLVVGLPVFFEVGFVLLIPIVFTVARRTGASIVLIALPMVAGLSVVQGLVPPHPAPMMVLVLFHADVGRTILYAFIVGIPTAILAGPLYAKLIAPHIHLDEFNPMAAEFVDSGEERDLPGFALTLFTVLLPVILMLIGSWANILSRPGAVLNSGLHLLGNADIALLIGVLVSFITLGTMRGISREKILKFSNECLAPTALITLLVGAGGGFGHILQDSGVSRVIVDIALHAHVPILLLAWMIAALIRIAAGSATVAMTTAAAIIAPVVLHGNGVQPELLVIATGAGSLFFSHVNDGGFWLIKEYLNMSVTQTIKTWSICETIISVNALVLTLLLSIILKA